MPKGVVHMPLTNMHSAPSPPAINQTVGYDKGKGEKKEKNSLS